MTERSSADAALRDRLSRVEESIARACADAGRARDEVTMLAVTKTVPIDDILAAIRLGVRHVGENRVQEYMEKRPALPAGVRTQLIGHLQSNKVRRIVGEVDQISSVDTLPLAQKISAVSTERGIEVRCRAGSAGGIACGHRSAARPPGARIDDRSARFDRGKSAA